MTDENIPEENDLQGKESNLPSLPIDSSTMREIYHDIGKPASKEFGKALQTVGQAVNLGLEPFRLMIWGYDKIKTVIEEKIPPRLKNTPPENITTPKPSVAVPTIEALRYVGEEEYLCDMYANLLASSMDKSTKDGALPAYAEIIKQLTSDEARILKYISLDIKKPIPIIDITSIEKNNVKGGIRHHVRNISLLGVLAKCEVPLLTSIYIDNFIRLGIAEIPYGNSYTNKTIYHDLKNHEDVKNYINEINETYPNRKVKINEKTFQITNFGINFIHICVQ